MHAGSLRTSLGILALATACLQAAEFTWTGGGAAGVWNDALNWSQTGTWAGDSGAGHTYPQDRYDRAVFAAATVTIASGQPSELNWLTTGAGTVTLPASLTLYQYNGGGSPPGGVSPRGIIGAGGLTGTALVFGNGGETFSSAGNVTLGTLGLSSGSATQTGGTWDITTINLPHSGTNSVAAWNISDGANTTFSHTTIANGTLTWTGTPVFTGGRPDYSFIRGGDGTKVYNLAAQTLWGDSLQLDGWPSGTGRYSVMNANGATVDLNTIGIGFGNASNGNTYINLDNTAVTIRGSGVAWDNRSTNNTVFDMRTGTTTTFDPAAGTLDLDTGSRDRGGDGVLPADWLNNFAFWNIVLGTGDTVRLVGTANIEGGGNNALYAHYLSGAGTLLLNGRNVYLDEYPAASVIFDTSLGGTVYAIPEPGALALLGLAAGALALRRRRG